MKTTWSWSTRNESDRLIHTAQSIGSGFFHLHHFYPLPWEPGVHYLSQGVYLPLLDYAALPDLWRRAKNFDNHALLAPPGLTDLQTALQAQLDALHLTPPDYRELEQAWAKIAPRFAKLVHTLVPYAPEISAVEIRPSYFGTIGSFSLAEKDGAHIIVEPRADATLSKLAECILTALTRPYLYKEHQATWEESEFLVDYLLRETALKELFPIPHQGTLEHLRSNVPASIVQESADFLTHIGAPTTAEQTFCLKHDTVYFGRCPLPDFSAREYLVMKELISHAPNPVSTDEIADLLYPDPEKFSLTALTKFVERLRDKLEAAGISRHYLATASGVGYYLKS